MSGNRSTCREKRRSTVSGDQAANEHGGAPIAELRLPGCHVIRESGLIHDERLRRHIDGQPEPKRSENQPVASGLPCGRRPMAAAAAEGTWLLAAVYEAIRQKAEDRRASADIGGRRLRGAAAHPSTAKGRSRGGRL